MYSSKLNIAGIIGKIESGHIDFIGELQSRYKLFCVNQENLPCQFKIVVYVKKRGLRSRKLRQCKPSFTISKTALRMKDSLLEYDAYFNFMSDEGRINIEGDWQEALPLFLRKIYDYYLMNNKGFFLHGACAIKNNISHIFLGGPGFGKTTISKGLARKGYKILHDDLICIRSMRGVYKVFTHPFNSLFCPKRHILINVNKLFFLGKGIKSTIERVSAVDYLPYLIESIPPFDRYSSLLKENFETACDILKRVETFKFDFSYTDKSWLDLLLDIR